LGFLFFPFEQEKYVSIMKEKVKRFNPRKCYGFIEGSDWIDYFVHQSEISSDYIHKENSVEFKTKETDRGLNAKNVKKI
jgi:cold shock CspA family protein